MKPRKPKSRRVKIERATVVDIAPVWESAHRLKFIIEPLNEPHKRVSFVLQLWQWERMKLLAAQACRTVANDVAREWNSWERNATPKQEGQS